MITFAELTKQVHLVKDLILSDMICGVEDKTEDESMAFSKRLLAMKSWFSRISCANKERYTLALLEDVRSAWAISCLLKSIWNCEPKDAVQSAHDLALVLRALRYILALLEDAWSAWAISCLLKSIWNCELKDAVQSAHERKPWSSYDQVPMDHNRTALPVYTLAQVMKNERFWFISLEPQAQAMVLLELLTLSGGPVMWRVLRRAHQLYERYRTQQLHNLKDCIVLNDQDEKMPQVTPEKVKKEDRIKSSTTTQDNSFDSKPTAGQVQKELESNLAVWYSTIKGMRDNLKLEELEMTFKDGTKRKIWKVNRPRPEAIETVDYIQLLPSEVAMRILSYLPRAMLGDYARVNKYWAYLVEELKTELATRQKLDADFEKLQELMLRHDTSMDVLASTSPAILHTSFGVTSTAPSTKYRNTQPSVKASEKSAGAYSFRHLVCDKLVKPPLATKPIPNLAELTDRLERRGAADENIWNWCDNILKNRRYRKVKKTADGVLPHDNVHFPSPMMKETLEVPLRPPLYKDPTASSSLKPKRNISNATVLNMPRQPDVNKRYSLWTKDFSSLYPVYKIPSHQSPI